MERSEALPTDSYVCLVTDELFPITYGGCGALLSNSICELLALGNKVLVLADIPEQKLQSFRQVAPIPKELQSNLELISVSTALEKNPNVSVWPDRSTPLRQSWRYWKALDWCLKKFDIRFVEFPDYKGWGYFALAAKCQQSEASRPLMTVRYHQPMEQIDTTAPAGLLGTSRFLEFQMERHCLLNTDKLLLPSEAMAKLATGAYQDVLTTDQQIVSPPSFAAWRLEPRPTTSPKNKILFYSRLAPMKGSDLFVLSALRLLSSGLAKDFEFVIAGPDMMQSPIGGAMSDYLVSLIPEAFQSSFKFTGNLDRAALTDLLPSVMFAVFPTQSETYCYAAREVMMAGVPAIVSNIPAFEDLIKQDAAMSVELTTEDLFQGMVSLIEDPSKLEKYETPWKPSTPLGKIYQKGPLTARKELGSGITLTVLILAETFDDIDLDSSAFVAARQATDRILIAVPSVTGQSRIMGRLCRIHDSVSNAEVTDPEVEQALCLLMQGDEVPKNFLLKSIDLLRQDNRLVCVGTDAIAANEPTPVWDRVPWDAAPELLPFQRPSLLLRCVARGKKARLSRRLLPQLSDYQEIHSVWYGHSAGGTLTRLFDQPICIDEAGEEKWRMALNPTSSAIGLRMLIDLFEFRGKRLRVGKVLQCLANYEMQQIGKSSIDRDVIVAVKKGYIPEIHGLRLNLSNIFKLLLGRAIYLFSIRPKSMVGTGQVLKAIARKLGLR